MSKILLIHGPNLNLLGTREPEKYGKTTSEDIYQHLKFTYSTNLIDYFQSNAEADIVNAIHHARGQYDGILINAGAFSHASIAIADAIKSVNLPCIAVHITNIYNREEFRQQDIVGDACIGAVVGLGVEGYGLAFETLLDDIS